MIDKYCDDSHSCIDSRLVESHPVLEELSGRIDDIIITIGPGCAQYHCPHETMRETYI